MTVGCPLGISPSSWNTCWGNKAGKSIPKFSVKDFITPLNEGKSKMVFDISFSYNNYRYLKLQARLYREKWDGTKMLGASCTHLYQHIRCFLALNMCYILHEDFYAICLFYSRCNIIPFLMYSFTLFLNTMCKERLYWQYFVIMMWLLFTDILIMFIIPCRIVRISMVNCFNLYHKIWQHCLRRLINCKRSALKLLWHPSPKPWVLYGILCTCSLFSSHICCTS